MIKYGFKIENGKIYDTKILAYKLFVETIDGNIIYRMKASSYRRLYLFEALLEHYIIQDVFEILRVNHKLKVDRKKEFPFLPKTLDYAGNMGVVLKYPPTYLNKKKYNLYKTCQILKKRLE